MTVAVDPVRAWAASGAMALSGRADGPPLGPPRGLVPKLGAIGARVGLGADATLGLLAERAALLGLARNGTTSCGGGARLLATADGWLALSLARAEDRALLPAWLDAEPDDDDPWRAVDAALASLTTDAALARAEGLGLPLSGVPVAAAPARATDDLPVGWSAVDGPRAEPRTVDRLRVVDLTSLWAGPLCGALLADLGAGVVKVESASRPDGARAGAPALFDRLNAGKRSVALDLATPAGHAALAELVQDADVVLEGSRPRALQAMGIQADAVLANGPRAWISITAHGRVGAAGLRVGFGDDAAAGGGLLAWEGDEPRFCADAVADPVTGLTAAAAVLEALERGGHWLVDVPMSGASRHLAGPTMAVPAEVVAAPPSAPGHRGTAAPLGADTAAVLGALR